MIMIVSKRGYVAKKNVKGELNINLNYTEYCPMESNQLNIYEKNTTVRKQIKGFVKAQIKIVCKLLGSYKLFMINRTKVQLHGHISNRQRSENHFILCGDWTVANTKSRRKFSE